MVKRSRKAKLGSKRPWLLFFLCLAGLAALLNIATVLPQLGTRPCANSISCIKDLSGNYEPQKQSTYLGKRVAPPSYIAKNPTQTQILGGSTNNKLKHIYVHLDTQRLTAYEGNKLVFDFPVSTGKWRPTPTGDFWIWIKLRYTHMEGGEGADYYNLYNVPYTMFFYNDEVPKSRGFSLHGAYWHNNFGHPMSHGCVNIRPEDAGKLFAWADPATDGTTTYATDLNPGTLVTVYGETPDF